MEIRCKKENCGHNTGCSCKAGSINVDKATHCDSYSPDLLKEELTEQHGHIFQVAESKVKRNLKNVPLQCNATGCLFNKEKRCNANGITVIDDKGKADCATFCES
ncbi:MAG: DUF1540 domain-containing protein [Christensenellaceae bacterium]|jgi:hypothetical protein|nr:DUF1540 domain-containing protein [Christensenellaceae bacterium]